MRRGPRRRGGRAISSSSCARLAPRALSISAVASASVRPRALRVEKVAGLLQRRSRQAFRRGDHAIFDRAVLGDQHGKRPVRLEPDEFDVLQPQIGLGRQHDARAAR